MNTKLYKEGIQHQVHPLKRMMMLAVLLCCVLSLTAQEDQWERNRVYNIMLGTIRYTHHDERMTPGNAAGQIFKGVMTGKTTVQAVHHEEAARNAIVRGLSNAYRYRFTERLAMYDDAEEGNLVADALITSIQIMSESRTYKDKNGKEHVTTNYKGVVEATLTLTDAKTGEVVATPTFSEQGTATSTSSSNHEKALSDAMNGLARRITAWLNTTQPLQANIIEGDAVKKEKQKKVYIDLGSREGGFSGLHMGVYIVKIVAGREARQQIGKLRIETVQGEDISLCKVISGGKEIKTAIEAGEQLQVVSY